MTIRVATAECFTHGMVGYELHAFSRGYPHEYPFRIHQEGYPLIVDAALFIPTLSGIRAILSFDPPRPVEILSGIKVYDQEGDRQMAILMADAVRRMANADIGIGTTAGIGGGGIAISGEVLTLVTSSGVYADLRSASPRKILDRKRAGLYKALFLFEELITGVYDPAPRGSEIIIPPDDLAVYPSGPDSVV